MIRPTWDFVEDDAGAVARCDLLPTPMSLAPAARAKILISSATSRQAAPKPARRPGAASAPSQSGHARRRVRGLCDVPAGVCEAVQRRTSHDPAREGISALGSTGSPPAYLMIAGFLAVACGTVAAGIGLWSRLRVGIARSRQRGARCHRGRRHGGGGVRPAGLLGLHRSLRCGRGGWNALRPPHPASTGLAGGVHGLGGGRPRARARAPTQSSVSAPRCGESNRGLSAIAITAVLVTVGFGRPLGWSSGSGSLAFEVARNAVRILLRFRGHGLGIVTRSTCCRRSRPISVRNTRWRGSILGVPRSRRARPVSRAIRATSYCVRPASLARRRRGAARRLPRART